MPAAKAAKRRVQEILFGQQTEKWILGGQSGGTANASLASRYQYSENQRKREPAQHSLEWT